MKRRNLTSTQDQPKNMWNWIQHQSIIYGAYQTKPSQTIAGFDLDFTLVKTKSGKVFPKDANDWIFWNQQVPIVMRKLHQQNYHIVIFTNQGGIGKGHVKTSEIKTKINNIRNQIDVPMSVFIATQDDHFRKPLIDSWQFFIEKMNGGIKPDLKKSFYCGDAAGRHNEKVKDHNNTDLLYAKNIGINFKTPQFCFLGINDLEDVNIGGFDPILVSEQGSLFKDQEINQIKFISNQMIILVGSPGSGKSTFAINYLKQYERINRDTLKTKQKCLKVAAQKIDEGKSVVIDNTNRDIQSRQPFVNLAKKKNLKLRVFVFQLSKQQCMHNDKQREVNKHRKHNSKKAGKISIHSFFKQFQMPTEKQGFDQIKIVNFVGKFQNDDDRKIYKSYIQGKR